MLNLRKIEKEEVKILKKWKDFAENEREKIEECASKFYNFEQNFAKQVNGWYGKVFENRKIHIFQQKKWQHLQLNKILTFDQ